MRKVTLHLLGLFASAGLAVGGATAQTQISIRATSITGGNQIQIAGLGDIGGGIGHGAYALGTCSYDGISRSYCGVTGNYVELAGSLNPGATGSFAWRMTWLGSGPNPIQVRSVSAASNFTNLYAVPPGSYFEVFLGNGAYANLDFGAPDTPNPTGGSLNWQAFLTTSATCTGSPVNCSVGEVMLAAGSTIQSPFSQFDMQLTYPATVVPEPSSIAMVAAGLLVVAVQGYRRRTKTPLV